MTEIAAFLTFLFYPSHVPIVNWCELPLNKLTLEQKIEMSIGCSYVGENRVYSDYTLEQIYDGQI